MEISAILFIKTSRFWGFAADCLFYTRDFKCPRKKKTQGGESGVFAAQFRPPSRETSLLGKCFLKKDIESLLYTHKQGCRFVKPSCTHWRKKIAHSILYIWVRHRSILLQPNILQFYNIQELWDAEIMLTLTVAQEPFCCHLSPPHITPLLCTSQSCERGLLYQPMLVYNFVELLVPKLTERDILHQWLRSLFHQFLLL